MDTLTNTAIIIYQMGKVGSTTLQASLEEASLPFSIYKVHFLSDAGMAHAVEFHQKTLKVPWENTPHIQTSELLREKIQTEPDHKWKVITLVREPIMREVSEFFQYVHSMYPELLDENGDIEKERAIKLLQTRLMFYNPEKNYTCRWFDMEIKGMFGLDVFAHPFDTTKGYSIIQQGNVDLLILRLEDLNRSFGEAVSQFLELDVPIELIQSNMRSEQKRGTTYEQVRQELTLRDSVCRKIYASTYARHFYSTAEIDQLSQKWSG
ncbi:MAG: sulfotransferase family 2 domain-containing protein [Anaerolineae bacterium]|nr:sulfotransferase family 2 domain-containing protein [Anaerolineae bacterium]